MGAEGFEPTEVTVDAGKSFDLEVVNDTKAVQTVTVQGRPGLRVPPGGKSQRQIDSRPFFHPLSSLPAYAQLEESARARARNVVSYRVSPRAINLPSPLNLTEAQAERVCAAVREILHA